VFSFDHSGDETHIVAKAQSIAAKAYFESMGIAVKGSAKAAKFPTPEEYLNLLSAEDTAKLEELLESMS